MHFLLRSTIVLSFFLSRVLYAQPEGFYLIEGEASPPVVDARGCTVVKVSKNATIGWNSFSVEQGETFRFEMEDSESSVINFVAEGQSTLSGNVQSDGKIYLNHPSKILVAREGVLNAPQIVLVSEGRLEVHGTLRANDPSGKGGKIHVLGEEVDIQVEAVIDASGAYGEGEVLIGGSFQGKDRSIPHSQQTIVQKGAQISVDALLSGNGGRAIVWSDKTTQFVGHINARGGPEGGNGGFVEVSGKDQLGFDGTVTTEAPKGKAGQLLLDPAVMALAIDGIMCPPGGIAFSAGLGSLVKVSLGSVFNVLASTNVTLQATTLIGISADVRGSFSFPPIPGRSLYLYSGAGITLMGNVTINVGPGNFYAYVNAKSSSTNVQPAILKIEPPMKFTLTSGLITLGQAPELGSRAKGATFNEQRIRDQISINGTGSVVFNYLPPASGGPKSGGPGAAGGRPPSNP